MEDQRDLCADVMKQDCQDNFVSKNYNLKKQTKTNEQKTNERTKSLHIQEEVIPTCSLIDYMQQEYKN